MKKLFLINQKTFYYTGIHVSNCFCFFVAENVAILFKPSALDIFNNCDR